MRSLARLWLLGMLRMVLASSRRKTCLIKVAFHSPVSSSISSETVDSRGSVFGCVIGQKVDGFGIHLSFQIRIVVPSPTCYR